MILFNNKLRISIIYKSSHQTKTRTHNLEIDKKKVAVEFDRTNPEAMSLRLM
jgi:hypothetical protein